MYNIKAIGKEQQITTAWAGGTTTQLAIFPIGSSYADRSFQWRLSTAVIELEESSFTKLSGFDRHLMVLEGELELLHKEQYKIKLKQYEQDSFKGSWDTSSFGKARDFNLMVCEGSEGRLEHHSILKEQCLTLELEQQSQSFYSCYSYKGNANIVIGAEQISIAEGEMLQISYNDYLRIVIQNEGQEECCLIAAYIFFPNVNNT